MATSHKRLSTKNVGYIPKFKPDDDVVVPHNSHDGFPIWLWIIISFAVLLFLTIIIILVICCIRRKKYHKLQNPETFKAQSSENTVFDQSHVPEKNLYSQPPGSYKEKYIEEDNQSLESEKNLYNQPPVSEKEKYREEDTSFDTHCLRTFEGSNQPPGSEIEEKYTSFDTQTLYNQPPESEIEGDSEEVIEGDIEGDSEEVIEGDNSFEFDAIPGDKKSINYDIGENGINENRVAAVFGNPGGFAIVKAKEEYSISNIKNVKDLKNDLKVFVNGVTVEFDINTQNYIILKTANMKLNDKITFRYDNKDLYARYLPFEKEDTYTYDVKIFLKRNITKELQVYSIFITKTCKDVDENFPQKIIFDKSCFPKLTPMLGKVWDINEFVQKTHYNRDVRECCVDNGFTTNKETMHHKSVQIIDLNRISFKNESSNEEMIVVFEANQEHKDLKIFVKYKCNGKVIKTRLTNQNYKWTFKKHLKDIEGHYVLFFCDDVRIARIPIERKIDNIKR